MRFCKPERYLWKPLWPKDISGRYIFGPESVSVTIYYGWNTCWATSPNPPGKISFRDVFKERYLFLQKRTPGWSKARPSLSELPRLPGGKWANRVCWDPSYQTKIEERRHNICRECGQPCGGVKNGCCFCTVFLGSSCLDTAVWHARTLELMCSPLHQVIVSEKRCAETSEHGNSPLFHTYIFLRFRTNRVDDLLFIPCLSPTILRMTYCL